MLVFTTINYKNSYNVGISIHAEILLNGLAQAANDRSEAIATVTTRS